MTKHNALAVSEILIRVSLRRRQQDSSSKKPSGRLSKKSPSFVTHNRPVPAVPLFQKVGNGLIFRIGPLKSLRQLSVKGFGDAPQYPQDNMLATRFHDRSVGLVTDNRIRSSQIDGQIPDVDWKDRARLYSGCSNVNLNSPRLPRTTFPFDRVFNSSHPSVRRKACA